MPPPSQVGRRWDIASRRFEQDNYLIPSTVASFTTQICKSTVAISHIRQIMLPFIISTHHQPGRVGHSGLGLGTRLRGACFPLWIWERGKEKWVWLWPRLYLVSQDVYLGVSHVWVGSTRTGSDHTSHKFTLAPSLQSRRENRGGQGKSFHARARKNVVN